MTLNYYIGRWLIWTALFVLFVGITHWLVGTDKPWLFDVSSHTFVAGIAFRIANHCGKNYPRMENLKPTTPHHV